MRTKKYSFAIFRTESGSDIVYVECVKNLKVDLTTAKELVTSRLDFTNNEKHYLIINMSNVVQVTSEAKVYMQDRKTGLKNILACAFIASNHVAALLANIFVKTPNVVSKFLASEKDALQWINEIKQKQKGAAV